MMEKLKGKCHGIPRCLVSKTMHFEIILKVQGLIPRYKACFFHLVLQCLVAFTKPLLCSADNLVYTLRLTILSPSAGLSIHLSAVFFYITS